MIRILIMAAAITLLAACASSEKKTKLALERSETEFMKRECQLNTFFVDEPEFANFNKTTFCSGELEVTKLEEISEIESIADYKITFKAKQKKLLKWLAAFEQMQTRKTPSPKQLQVKTLIQKIAREKRDWVYQKQTVKLNLTDAGWMVEDVIR